MAGMFGSDSQLALDAGGTSTIIQGKLEEPDHSSANWYFCREEIEGNSPSRSDGIDLKKETYFRKSYCTFLQDLGMRLKVPQVTIATAITFCHRFFLRQSHAKNDRLMIATICMFLAGKVEETPRPIRDVIHVSYEIRNKKDPQAVQRIKDKDVLEAQKDLVLYGERLVLTTLGFDLNIHHPYKPLVAAIKRFKVPQNALAQVAWNFVNDGLRTSLCLQFKPHHIAAGAIFLAAKFLKVKLPNDGERAWWQEFGVTPRQLEEVSNQMLELYEQNKAPPTSSDPNAAAETGVQYRNANIHNDTGTYYGVKSIHADSHVPVINHQSPLLDRRNTMLGRKTRNGYSNGVDKNDEDTEDKDDMVCGSRDSLAAGGADESYCSEGLTAKERALNCNHLGGSHVHVKQEANRLRDAESLNNVRFSSKQPSADVSISDNQQNLERPISHSLESNRSRYKSIDNYSDKDELLHSSVGTTTDQIRDIEPSGKKRKKDISALDRKSVKVKNEKSYGSAGILETMLQQRAEEGELYSHELSHSPKAVDRNLKPVNDEKASSPMKRREVDRDHYGRKDDNKHRYTHNRDHHHHNLQQRSVADREHHYHKDHEWQEQHDQKARYDH